MDTRTTKKEKKNRTNPETRGTYEWSEVCQAHCSFPSRHSLSVSRTWDNLKFSIWGLLLQVRTDIRNYGLIELPFFTACASFLDLRSSRRPWKRPWASTYSHLIQPRRLTLGLNQYGQVSVEQPRAIH
ncbi:hypothetical protein PISMIDRAFT_323004 [Pisolithus microcarpus 441]|uniref:Uncharacterized protein n=1 Tax=Pisolithus microcarpus 441 TaxID=765257 RepID=A0A0C9YNC9_9AGAM|nr:hypothetical protein PISMIDRAFT_323004 [Pisolithus microcarpus 441]